MKTKKTTSPKLKQLAKRFAQWRENRSSSRARIPDDLLDEALLLTEVIQKSKVLAQLKMNGTQIKRRQQDKAQANRLDIDFVRVSDNVSTVSETTEVLGHRQQTLIKIPMASPIVASPITTPTLEFSQPNGQKLSISGVSMEQMGILVNQFMAVL